MAGRKPVLSAEQRIEAARLYRDGWSEFQISDRFGVSRDTVQRALIAQGVEKRAHQEGREAARRSGWHTWRRERRSTHIDISQALNQWRAR